MSAIESASLEQLKVHMQYMRDTVDKLHSRLDDMPSAKQIKELEERVEALQIELHEQSKLMTTLVNLERFAKWLSGIIAVVVAGWGLVKLIKSGG